MTNTAAQTPATVLADRRALRASPGPVALPDARAFSRVVEPGTCLAVLEGTAWVTLEGDGLDHVLEAPATFVATVGGRLAVQALGPVRFELTAARLAA